MSTSLKDDEIYHPDLEDDEENLSDDLNPKEKPAKCPPATVEVLDYVVTRDIKKPRSQAYSLEWVYKQLKDNLIDLNAEYQRDVVWTKEKQSFLIDSIFNNHYVPPIILSIRKRENEIDETRVCIDGKQRLTAIMLATGRLLWFKNNPDLLWPPGRGKKYLLPANMKRSFENRSMVCVEYEEVSYGEERDIFKRVQLGVPLTAAEKLQAISTPRVRFIQKLRTQFMVPEKLGNPAIPWNRSRCRDFHILALSVYYATTWDFKGPTLPLVHSDTLATWLGEQPRGGKDDGEPSDGVPVPPKLQNRVIRALETMTRLFTTSALNQPFVSFVHNGKLKALSPIDVIGTFFLVYKLTQLSSRPATDPTLSQLGETMRRNLRDGNSSLKMRSPMLKLAQQFCIKAAEDLAKRSRMLTGSPVPGSSSSSGLASRKEGALKRRALTDTSEDSLSEVESEDSTCKVVRTSTTGVGNRIPSVTTKDRRKTASGVGKRKKRVYEEDEFDGGDDLVSTLVARAKRVRGRPTKTTK
ncbi:hypothetical protein PM082_017829 [Marasmius tenuissimus]|nr:hypothetical protein PM082_017829 [Marasmius tenuissimus]